MTPTQRTIAALKDQGIWHVAIVERYIKSGNFGHRSDMFGIIDLVALSPYGDDDCGCIVGIQVFGQTGWAAHVNTIMVEKKDNTHAWLRAGGKLQLWGWRKLKVKRGMKRMKWTPRIGDITLHDSQIILTERN